jgi:hypothetical protein
MRSRGIPPRAKFIHNFTSMSYVWAQIRGHGDISMRLEGVE